MTALTSQSMLTDVETAISKILAGGVAEYYIGGKRVTYFDLDKLCRLRDDLRARVALETDGTLEAQVTFS